MLSAGRWWNIRRGTVGWGDERAGQHGAARVDALPGRAYCLEAMTINCVQGLTPLGYEYKAPDHTATQPMMVY
jgi:hypothetical protein